MEATPKTITITVDPQKFLEKYPNTFENLRNVAMDAKIDGKDIRVEFLVVPALPGTYIPLSAMPSSKGVRS